VFTFRGEPVGQVNIKTWTAALQRAGIEDFKWHDLRRTFATWHRQAGTPTHERQRFEGWKTGAMVERYAHVAPEALQGGGESARCVRRVRPGPRQIDQRPRHIA